MAKVQISSKDMTTMMDPPSMSAQAWNLAGVLGIVLLVMAVLQVISFGDFKDWFTSVGISGATTWAIVVIVAEAIAALGFFKLSLSAFVRMLSAWLAILVSGFWFVENLWLVSAGKSSTLTNSGYFGKYLSQSPGWWTVIEATVFIFWVVYVLEMAMMGMAKPKK